MAVHGEPADRFLSRLGRRALPPILATRFEVEAGEDLDARDRLLAAVREEALGGASPVFGETVFDAPTVTLPEILDAAREVSLLAPRRLVLVRGSRLASGVEGAEEGDEAAGGGEGDGSGRPALPAAGGRDSDAAQVAALKRYLEGAADGACVVFSGCPWDARRRVHKAVLEAATVVDISRPDPREIPSWIEARVRERGRAIEPEAVRLLGEMRGADTLRIRGELAKLALYAQPGRPITAADVRALVGGGEAPTAWALVDAMADGDASRAVGILRRILDDGEPVPAVVGAIASRLRQMIVLRDERALGRANEAARKVVFPGRSIYFADALAHKASRFPRKALLDALATLYDVDRLSKSSGLDAGACLEAWLTSALKSGGFVRS